MAATSSRSLPAPTRNVRVERDGAEIHGEFFDPPGEAESPNLPAIVILDGIGCAGWAFRRIVPALAQRTTVLFAYYRGHGPAPTPPHPWRLSMPVLAEDALALCDAAGIDRICTVGFSMGFSVALEILRAAPARVAGQVSIAGPPGRVLAGFQGTGIFEQLVPLVRGATHLTGILGGDHLLREVWTRVLPSRAMKVLGMYTQVDARRLHEEDLEVYLHDMARIDPELFLEMLHEASVHDPSDLLPLVEIPTLFIAGGRDRFVPLDKLRGAAFRIPNAQWEVIPEGTHALPAEHPARIATDLLRFVDGLGTPGALPEGESAPPPDERATPAGESRDG